MISVDNNSTQAACTGFLPFYEVTSLLAAMLSLHAVTLAVLISHACAMARNVRLDHPVFAVIFQEMIILIVCSCADSSLLVVAIFNQTELLMVAYLNVARMAMLFHPVTWLVVSLLR